MTDREKALEWFFGLNEIEKQELKEKFFPDTFIEYDSKWGYRFGYCRRQGFTAQK